MNYLDNAASSSPKPLEVVRAVTNALTGTCANPGRSGHKAAVNAAREVLSARESLQRFFHAPDPFCFTFGQNCTDALNTAIMGVLKKGDHCIMTAYEHNSVLRTVHACRLRHGVSYTVVAPDHRGRITCDAIANAMTDATKLVICNHISNVLGIRQPIEDIAALCRERGVLFLADAAQSAGHTKIDLSLPIDMMALPGHKGLLGPQGTGALYVRPDLKLEPFHFGGTGSESFSLVQPEILPDRLESGTLNVPGIAGLNAGIGYVEEHFYSINVHEMRLTSMLNEGLRRIKGVTVYSPVQPESNLVLFNLPMDSTETADLLDARYDIACRGGYHCAPLVHQFLGTEKTGAVRLSIGHSNTESEILFALDAIKELARYAME